MKQTDSSDSSPVGVINTHLDSKGYYFANGVNIIPGQNMPLDSITKEQAQNILKSEVINYINSEDLIALQKIANQPVFNVPIPTRVGQVLTSKVVNGKLIATWDDLTNVPQTSSEFGAPTDNGDTGIDATGVFTRLVNATYTAANKYDENGYLAPTDTSKPYGGDLVPLDNEAFALRPNLQNKSVTFTISTPVDIVIKNNPDGTLTVIDGLQELATLNTKANGRFVISNGGDTLNIFIGYDVMFEGFTEIRQDMQLEGGRILTGITVDGSASTNFCIDRPFSGGDGQPPL